MGLPRGHPPALPLNPGDPQIAEGCRACRITDLGGFRPAVIGWVTRGGEDARALATGHTPGELDLARECIISMGGATTIAKYLDVLTSLGLRVAGLCDAGEERYFRRALDRVGLGTIDSREGMAAAGFFVRVKDLEDELIRALAMEAVQRVLQKHGD